MSTAAARLAIIDYGMGNRRSVQKALEHFGADVTITSGHQLLREADGLVLPGVGAFPRAMQNLGELGLIELIRERAADGVPLLGICLGMQLLFESSQELGHTPGLGLLAGAVTQLQSGGLRVPHIGWNEVCFERSSPLTDGLPSAGCAFYHVHSLAARPTSEEVIVATADYGERFVTIVVQGSVMGVQFHPEKSSVHGLEMLGNFVQLCVARPAAARA